MSPSSFKARFDGFCGACGKKIFAGQDIVFLPNPAEVKVYVPYDYERQRGGWDKQISTKVRHTQCPREKSNERRFD